MRVVIRCIPGFTWVQLCVSREWQVGNWWSVRGIARTHSLGFLRVLTMREDCLERIKRNGMPE